MVATSKLVQIAGWGGIIVSATGFILQNEITNRIKTYDYYKKAFKILRAHPGAIHYIGKPIKDYAVKLTDTEHNYSDGKNARFRVPISGSKDSGAYYFWAKNIENDWKIVKAEVELKSDPGQRLVIIKDLPETNEN